MSFGLTFTGEASKAISPDSQERTGASMTPEPKMEQLKVETIIEPKVVVEAEESPLIYNVSPLVASHLIAAKGELTSEKPIMVPKTEAPGTTTTTPVDAPKGESPILPAIASEVKPAMEAPVVAPAIVTPVMSNKVLQSKMEPVVPTLSTPTIVPVVPKSEVKKDPSVGAPLIPAVEENQLKPVEDAARILLKKKIASARNLADEFDDILDGAAPIESVDELLGWSLEAFSGNMSDWEILVQNQDEEVPVSYHVHRLVLSTGPTKSEYFENIIRSDSAVSTSQIVLSKSAALAFPQFLDFMYSREDKVDVTTCNAAALRFLGRYFGVRKLVVLVTTFVRDDLMPSSSLHYLNAAAEFHDEKLMTTAAQLCAQNIATTAVNREGLTNLDPPLFSMVVSFPNVACSSGELSKYVAEFARKHDSEMNVELLSVVADSKNMPSIDPCEAVYLLQLSEKHNVTSDLRDRCIQSCATAWHGTLVSQVVPAFNEEGPYGAISSPLKVALLEKALIQAQVDYFDAKATQVAILEREKTQLLAKDTIIDAKDRMIKEMKNAHLELLEKCTKLETELARFTRVPCEYSFPKKKECTFDKTAASSKKSLFGTAKPSKMPLQSTAIDLDGYLFESGSFLLPIYYYKGS